MLPYAVSYDAYIRPDDDKRLEVFLRDVKSECQEKRIFLTEIKSIVRSALKSLPHRERFIIEKRFGLKDDCNLTLEAISKSLQLSKERVRQLERDALGKLKGTLQTLREEILAA